MKTLKILTAVLILSLGSGAFAANGKEEKKEAKAPKVIKKVRYKKTQEVSFDSENVDGVARNPYGAYLTQKRGIDFAPLYKVRERFDESIKDSVQYLRVEK
jgi:hypothetical protein